MKLYVANSLQFIRINIYDSQIVLKLLLLISKVTLQSPFIPFTYNDILVVVVVDTVRASMIIEHATCTAAIA